MAIIPKSRISQKSRLQGNLHLTPSKSQLAFEKLASCLLVWWMNGCLIDDKWQSFPSLIRCISTKLFCPQSILPNTACHVVLEHWSYSFAHSIACLTMVALYSYLEKFVLCTHSTFSTCHCIKPCLS